MAGSPPRCNGFASFQRERVAAGILLVLPSRDLRGGIEKYVAGITDAVTQRGILQRNSWPQTSSCSPPGPAMGAEPPTKDLAWSC